MRPASVASTRARPVVLIALAGSLLVLRLATGFYDARHPPRAGGLVNWQPMDTAAAEQKPIFYDFSASWCEPCRKMERELFANAEAASYINANFIPVHVTDEDTSATATALRTEYDADALPTLVVISKPKGEPHRVQGYSGKRQALAFLKYALKARPKPDAD